MAVTVRLPGTLRDYVGGNTKVYGAILFRLRERDFGAVQHYGGVSPAWPLTYDDFEPCMSVTRTRAGPVGLPPRCPMAAR